MMLVAAAGIGHGRQLDEMVVRGWRGRPHEGDLFAWFSASPFLDGEFPVVAFSFYGENVVPDISGRNLLFQM